VSKNNLDALSRPIFRDQDFGQNSVRVECTQLIYQWPNGLKGARRKM
jgi:hypothetical protein